MMKKLTFVGAAAAVLMASASAQAAVIDFNEFTHGGNFIFVNPFNSGGFNFTNNGGGGANEALGVWGSSHISNMDPGGAAILHNYAGSITTVSKVGGGTFDFNSIDLADVYNDGSSGDILFTFTDWMGTTAQTVTIDNLIGGQTFAFNRTGLSSFTMQAATTPGPWMQFDNLVVNAMGAVPEPSAWGLLILGFGFVGGTMRSTKRKGGTAVSYA